MPNVHSEELRFPVFAITFAPHKPLLLVGGGGGATKAGVKNALMLFAINESNLETTLLSEHLFEKTEDGCMSIAVHPVEKTLVASVNSSEELIKSGNNQNIRVFHISKVSELIYKSSFSTMDSKDPFHHQKASCYNDRGYLGIGTTDGKFVVYGRRREMIKSPLSMGGEVIDITCKKEFWCVVARESLHVFDNGLKKVWSIEKGVSIGAGPCEFRSARFGANTTKNTLFVVVNAKNRKKSYLCKWSTDTWTRQSARPISTKPVTAFAISKKGDYLALGTADLAVTLLDAVTTRVLRRFDKIHSFPVTALAFSPTGRVVVSGSADSTISVMAVSREKGSCGSILLWIILFAAIVAALFVLYVRSNEQDDL